MKKRVIASVPKRKWDQKYDSFQETTRPKENGTEVSVYAIRMAVIKKARNNQCWHGSGEKETLIHCWWDCKLMQPLWKIVWRFLKELKIELLYNPAIPLLVFI